MPDRVSAPTTQASEGVVWITPLLKKNFFKLSTTKIWCLLHVLRGLCRGRRQASKSLIASRRMLFMRVW